MTQTQDKTAFLNQLQEYSDNIKKEPDFSFKYAMKETLADVEKFIKKMPDGILIPTFVPEKESKSETNTLLFTHPEHNKKIFVEFYEDGDFILSTQSGLKKKIVGSLFPLKQADEAWFLEKFKHFMNPALKLENNQNHSTKPKI